MTEQSLYKREALVFLLLLLFSRQAVIKILNFRCPVQESTHYDTHIKKYPMSLHPTAPALSAAQVMKRLKVRKQRVLGRNFFLGGGEKSMGWPLPLLFMLSSLINSLLCAIFYLATRTRRKLSCKLLNMKKLVQFFFHFMCDSCKQKSMLNKSQGH